MIAERIIVMDQNYWIDGSVRHIFSQGKILDQYGIKPPTTARI